MGQIGCEAPGAVVLTGILTATVLLSAIAGAFGSAAPAPGPLARVLAACGPPVSDCASANSDRASGSRSDALPPWDPALAFAWTKGASAPVEPGEGAGLAPGPTGNEAILFGGEVSGNLSSQTLLYYASGNGSWVNYSPLPSPSARAFFAFASDLTSGTAVLFGGLIQASSGRVDNTTWIYHFTSHAWVNVSSGVAPPPRAGAAFAIDPAGGFGLLYGGWNPSYSPISSITYGDLWRLNLTNDHWSAVTVNGSAAPPPLQGASLAWNPTLGTFQLFGGCYPCSSAVWSYRPSTNTWQPPQNLTGDIPTARGYATWAWEPVHGSDLLFGGGDGSASGASTFEYFPNQSEWVRLAPPTSPDPRFAAAGAWLNASGNASLLVTGGNLSTGSSADLWSLSPTSNLTVLVQNRSSGLGVGDAYVKVGRLPGTAVNSTGVLALGEVVSGTTVVNVSALGYADEEVSVYLPPASSRAAFVDLTWVAPASLLVKVEDPGGAPVADAEVNVTVGTSPIAGSPWYADGMGLALVQGLPSGIPAPTGLLSASAPLNYTNSLPVPLQSGVVRNVTLTLTPYPYLEVQVLGALANGTRIPLWHASILVDQLRFGETAPNGWRNATSPAPGAVAFTVSAFGFGTVYPEYTLPHTGVFRTTIVLEGVPFGQIQVVILDAATQIGIGGATAFALPVPGAAGTSLPTGGISGTTGIVDLTVPIGAYNVTASAYGYFPNATLAPVLVGEGATTSVTLVLRLEPGATVHVLVHDATNATPLGGAGVTLGSSPPERTGPSGWANFTNVHFGPTQVNVSDAGYRPNTTELYLTPSELLPLLLINLTPLGSTPTYTGPPSSTGAFSGFETVVAQIAPFLALLVILVMGVVAYLVFLHAPEDETDPTLETPAPVSRRDRVPRP